MSCVHPFGQYLLEMTGWSFNTGSQHMHVWLTCQMLVWVDSCYLVWTPATSARQTQNRLIRIWIQITQDRDRSQQLHYIRWIFKFRTIKMHNWFILYVQYIFIWEFETIKSQGVVGLYFNWNNRSVFHTLKCNLVCGNRRGFKYELTTSCVVDVVVWRNTWASRLVVSSILHIRLTFRLFTDCMAVQCPRRCSCSLFPPHTQSIHYANALHA